MTLKVGLAVKNFSGLEALTDEFDIQTQILTHSDIDHPGFGDHALDLIIWQPVYSQGKLPRGLERFLANHQDAGLVICDAGAELPDLPESTRNMLLSVIERPVSKHSLKLLVYNATLLKKQSALPVTTTYAGINGSDNLLVGNSDAIKRMAQFITAMGKTRYTGCLIRGEKGTEKEYIARLIHSKSMTAEKPLQIVDCRGASRDELLSGLFGLDFSEQLHGEPRVGALEKARAGTLILKNIELMDEEVQQRLEVFLNAGIIRPIGKDKDVEIDTRLIVISETNLETFVKQGSFLKELYFRLKAFELVVPPLRNRREDILPLTDLFVRIYNIRFGHKVEGLSSKSQDLMMTYDWPGNVSELKLMIKRSVLITKKGLIEVQVLPGDIGRGAETAMYKPDIAGYSLQEMERVHIENILASTNWNKSRAAEILNISRTTLREKMRLFQLDKPMRVRKHIQQQESKI
jgi:DNA-binding NtrC family response regulator